MPKILFVFFCFLTSIYAQENTETKSLNKLLSNISQTIDSNTTNRNKLLTVKEHLSQYKIDKKYKFNIMSHKENFLLLAGHTSDKLTEKHWNKHGERDKSDEYSRNQNEVQFQLSLKIPLAYNLFKSGGDLFVAYTQNSYWQVYDTEHSSPFRETNYMPELFVEWHPDKKIGNSELKKVRLAFIHQSNGQDIGQSRSWNRTEIDLLFQYQNIHYGINIWDRWNEDTKKEPSSTKGDDNVDLEDFIGKQKYFIKYKNDNYAISLTHQNDILNYDLNKGNSVVDILIPSMSDSFNFFIRYFNGYGESLIDYDVKIERISFGIMIADWN